MQNARHIHLSALFTIYNRVRRKPQFERKRVDRALGLLMQKDQSWRSKYLTDVSRCTCPDNTGRRVDPDTLEVIATWEPHICKHRIAFYIEALMYMTYTVPALEHMLRTAPRLERASVAN